MSKLYFIVLFIFFSYSICIKCEDVTYPSEPNSCKGLELNGEYTQCCYLRRKVRSVLGRITEDFRSCARGNA